MKSRTRILAPLVGLAVSCTAAQAAVLTFGYTTATTATSLAPPPGMQTVAAFNYGTPAATPTVAALGGVNFQGTTADFTTVNGIRTVYSVPGVAFAVQAGPGFFPLGNDVLTYTGYTWPSADGRLEFEGLTIGQPYTFQFITADGRDINGVVGRQFEIVGAAGTNEYGTSAVEGTSNKHTYAYTDGQFGVITATFTAESANAWFLPRIYDSNGGAAGTQINAVHIMTVPEPSAALLGGLGLLGLLRRRRH